MDGSIRILLHQVQVAPFVHDTFEPPPSLGMTHEKLGGSLTVVEVLIYRPPHQFVK